MDFGAVVSRSAEMFLVLDTVGRCRPMDFGSVAVASLLLGVEVLGLH